MIARMTRPPDRYANVGARVREARESRNLSLADLARTSGVDRSAISQIEVGTSKAPSFANGVRLARALGVSAAYLAGVEREAPADLTVQLDDGAVIGVEVRVHSYDPKLSSAVAEEIVLQRVTNAIGPGAQVIGTRKLSEAGVSLLPGARTAAPLSTAPDPNALASLESSVGDLADAQEAGLRAIAALADALAHAEGLDTKTRDKLRLVQETLPPAARG